MTSAQVIKTSVTVDKNSSFQKYPLPDDHTRQTTKLSFAVETKLQVWKGKDILYGTTVMSNEREFL